MATDTLIEGAVRSASPFRGLVPYSEEDASFFFGRDDEIEVVIANLEARRLTLLYGESGVGKSSLLRAGVLHRLRRLARQNLEELGTPEIVPVYFAAWRDDPVVPLIEAIGESVSAVIDHVPREAAAPQTLEQAIEYWSKEADADILIVLDQFEEYFRYHTSSSAEETFAAALPRAVNDASLRARFLISIREDSLAKLDRFKRTIPTLFGTYIRVRHLRRESADGVTGPAEEAIIEPITVYNSTVPAEESVELESLLVTAVLDDLTAKPGELGEWTILPSATAECILSSVGPSCGPCGSTTLPRALSAREGIHV